MNYKQPKKTVHSGPETAGARRLRLYMQAHGWLVIKIHGGKFQSGLPDFYCIHLLHGHCWIETKIPGGKLSASQRIKFEKMDKYGDKIFVLFDEKQYHYLFSEPNWRVHSW